MARHDLSRPAGGGAATASIGGAAVRTAGGSPYAPIAVLRDGLAGAVVSGVFLAYCLSFSAMIFSGDLAPGLPLGLNAILLGAGVTGVVVALFSSLPRAVGGPDTPSVAVVSVLAVSVAAAIPAATGTETTLRVLTAICATTFLTGLFLMILGVWRLGWIARFVPYSVIAGFLTASGILLIGGAFRVATGTEVSWTALGAIAQGDMPGGGRLLFAIGLAASVFLIRLRVRSIFVLPAVVIAGAAGLHAWLLFGGVAIDQARALGWFLTAPEGAGLAMPLLETQPLLDTWPALVDSLGEIASVAVVTTMAVILNTSSLEAVWKTNANLNAEFRVAGAANMLSGILGGIAGNISINRSMLNRECGAAGRLSAVIPGIACLALLGIGAPVLTAFPMPVLAGLLLFLGASILISTLGWSSPRRDFPELLHVLLITSLILLVGYLEGLIVGLIGACILFAYTYSRVDIIKREQTRRERASTVDRPPEQARFLIERGHLIRVVELQGYLFFATSNRLVEHLKNRIQGDPAQSRIDFLIVDFRLVTGLDISTALSFAKLRNTCEEAGVMLILSGMPDQVRKVILESNQSIVDGAVVRAFDSLDAALDFAEESLLAFRGSHLPDSADFAGWLGVQLGSAAAAHAVMPYLDRLTFGDGDRVVAQGAPSDSIDLVASGRVSVMLEQPGTPPVRLRSMLDHTVLGEMGFYRGSPRGASVFAEQDTVVWRLDRQAFDDLAAVHPAAAAAFHQFIICVLSDRLAFANATIASLER